MQHAVRRFGCVLKFHSNATARHPPVSVSVGGAGSPRSARAILTTTIIRYGKRWKGLLPVSNGILIAMRKTLQYVVTCDNMAGEVLDDKNNSPDFLDQRCKEAL